MAENIHLAPPPPPPKKKKTVKKKTNKSEGQGEHVKGRVFMLRVHFFMFLFLRFVSRFLRERGAPGTQKFIFY